MKAMQVSTFISASPCSRIHQSANRQDVFPQHFSSSGPLLQRSRPSRTSQFSWSIYRVALAAAFVGKKVIFSGRSKRHLQSRLRAQNIPSDNETVDEKVEVVTWNILSSSLCTHDYYRHNDPEDLDSPKRLRRVFKKLQGPVERGAVLCLQECSERWTGHLHAWFQQRNYHFVTSLYGYQITGWMGVGIAFPSRKFELQSASIQRISEAKNWAPQQRTSPPKEGGSGLLSTLLDFAGYFGSPNLLKNKVDGDDDEMQNQVQAKEDIWIYSRKRQNTMVAIKLRPKKGSGKVFTVATYHMPCVYWLPEVMTIHTALAAQYAIRFAGDVPLILAGDFNFKPGSPPYQLLTTGKLPESSSYHPGTREGEDWKVEQGLKLLRSAYAERHPGGEPEFTNYCWTKDDIDPFIGTLDYIFVSSQAEIASVARLPSIQEIPHPLPTSEEPSDHLMVSAMIYPHGKPLPQFNNDRISRKAETPSFRMPPRPSTKTAENAGAGTSAARPTSEASRSRTLMSRPNLVSESNSNNSKASSFGMSERQVDAAEGKKVRSFGGSLKSGLLRRSERSISDSKKTDIREAIRSLDDGY
eukprot:TRINITY_DN4626_c0_g1_i2.p1 TRINITY_DN4626_c0_g1~~TRINITY_DN4626_c0_g1_i2.p1  ORF type:complete len:582 (-),score=80.72 TRINITY_DN4626_c0_g1_i2:69-1814(-)